MRSRYALISLSFVILAACRPAGTGTASLPASAMPATVTLAPASTATASPVALSNTPGPSATLLSEAQTTGTPPARLTPQPELSPEAVLEPPPRLLIPKLKIDREIITVPIVNGDWDLTNLGDNVGRLETTGQSPGDTLAMVIAGHITTSVVDLGPFANIWKLRAGDTVIVRLRATDYVYAVQKKKYLPPDATRSLYVADGRRLLLLTCSGWDALSRTWSQRLIVEAGLTDPVPLP